MADNNDEINDEIDDEIENEGDTDGGAPAAATPGSNMFASLVAQMMAQQEQQTKPTRPADPDADGPNLPLSRAHRVICGIRDFLDAPAPAGSAMAHWAAFAAVLDSHMPEFRTMFPVTFGIIRRACDSGTLHHLLSTQLDGKSRPKFFNDSMPCGVLLKAPESYQTAAGDVHVSTMHMFLNGFSVEDRDPVKGFLVDHRQEVPDAPPAAPEELRYIHNKEWLPIARFVEFTVRQIREDREMKVHNYHKANSLCFGPVSPQEQVSLLEEWDAARSGGAWRLTVTPTDEDAVYRFATPHAQPI